MKRTLLAALPGLCWAAAAAAGAVPVIDGPWWSIAGNPDLGTYTSPKQQPVDFGVWRAADGTWQLWSCIRHTKCGGNTRLFYRWEGRRPTDTDWQPKGIAMEADTALGEQPGGLQAPHVITVDGAYLMFYGDWKRICLARSRDGKDFKRVLNEGGQPDLFSGPYPQSRDAMVLRAGGLYYCYYTGHDKSRTPQCAVFCRTSADLRFWSEPVIVCAGGSPAGLANWYGGNCECPFVVRRDDRYYLFRNQRYGQNNLNTQYCSANPLAFGVDDDRLIVAALPVAAPEIVRHEGHDYIVALKTGLDGIRAAKLRWEEKNAGNATGSRTGPQ